MRKLFWFMLVSLDGYFEGPNHDLSWHNVDEEFNEFAVKQTGSIDTFLYGRRTYQLFEDFWAKALDNPEMSKEDLEVARLIDFSEKIVFSKTLTEVKEQKNWQKVKLLHDVNADYINQLKQKEGKAIGVFGSNALAVSLLEKNLLDEMRLLVNPIVIRQGTPLFKGLTKKMNFQLIDTRTFKNGNVLLSYQTKK